MDDDAVFETVQAAIIWAKAQIVTLAPTQVTRDSLLADHPICLDSLESIAMVTRLEDTLGLVAEDEHFFSGRVRTVGDVVTAVQGWLAAATPVEQ